MSGNLKLDQLKYGTLNDLSPAPQGDSGDRRRTTNVVALSNAIEAAYSINTTLGVNEYNGIVVYHKDIEYATYQDRTSLLQEYVVQSNASRAENEPETMGQYKNIVYKVYIPELEPRPAPGGKEDQCVLLRTYPDVYSDLPPGDPSPIPLGTIVAVRFEDKERLFNPRIVKVLGEPLRISDVTAEPVGPYAAERFRTRRRSTVGRSTRPRPGPTTPSAPPAQVPTSRSNLPATTYRRDNEDYPMGIYDPYSPELEDLLREALAFPGVWGPLPEGWALLDSTHEIISKESGGKVGVPNYTYDELLGRDPFYVNNIKKKPDYWPEVWEHARQGIPGVYDGRSSATGLGQLLSGMSDDGINFSANIPQNVQLFYADGVNGISDPLNEAVGYVQYIRDRYGDPDTAWSVYGQYTSYRNTRTNKVMYKRHTEGY